MNHRTLGFLYLCVTSICSATAAPPDATTRNSGTVIPLTNAHAHNDYEHTRPLLDALDNGFCSVEADIHLVDGKLLVAHNREAVRADRTLQSLYLEPLRQRAKRNNGRIYAKGPVSMTLLIDIKTDAAPTYAALRTVLAGYKDILTEFRANGTTPRAVTAVLSGSRPTIVALSAESPRYAGYDGRLEDLDKKVAPSVMPLVSQDWEAVSTWKGDAGIPIAAAERKRVSDTIAKAHRQGYRIRFWATPDTVASWRLMRDLGIDLINTDDLPGLCRFLRADQKQP